MLKSNFKQKGNRTQNQPMICKNLKTQSKDCEILSNNMKKSKDLQ